MIINRTRQRGVALIALLAVIILAGSYLFYRVLNASTASASIERSQRDSDVLQQAKVALIGQIALQAASATEENPGRLPCPENPADAGNAGEGMPQGVALHPFGFCGNGTTVMVGRLPWKALGIEKLQDSFAEPLWYAVAATWVPQDGLAASRLTINSDTPATGTANSWLAVPGDADVIAAIFAPSQALPGQARRPLGGVNPAPAVANYLDLENATPLDGIFAKTGPSDTFNDHVITITRAELMPEIEAAVADRFARQIAPQIRTAYSSGSWTTASPILPFAAVFGDPSLASYKGTSATSGLLPVSYSTTGACSPGPCVPVACTPGPANPRCAQDLVTWIATGLHAPTVTSTAGMTAYGAPSCTAAGTVLTCTVQASATLASAMTWMEFNLGVSAAGIGNALRQLNDTVPVSGDVDTVTLRPPYGYSIGAALLNTDDSSGTVTLASRFAAGSGTALGFLGATDCAATGLYCRQFTISIPLPIFNDHPVIDATNPTTGWFVRNQWHQLSYYAIASGVAPNQSAPRSCTPPNCLTVNYVSAAANYPSPGTTPYAADSVMALVVLAGRRLEMAGQIRPNSAPGQYFEDANSGGTATYAARAPTLVFNRTFNDRVVVISHN